MKKQMMLLLCAFAAVSFASCTKEADLNGGAGDVPSISEGEGFGYLAVSLKTDLTRADFGTNGSAGTDTEVGDENFNPGDANEYKLTDALNAHLAIFLDENYKYFGNSYLTPRSGLASGSEDHDASADPNGSYADTEKLYTYITRDPRVSKGDQKPSFVLVVLNASPARIQEILEAIPAVGSTTGNYFDIISSFDADKDNHLSGGTYKVGEDTFFTMTNSTYIDPEDETKIICATAIDGNVYESPEIAAQNPVTIYVERMVAKYSLKIKDAQGTEKTFTGAANETALVFAPTVVTDSDDNATNSKQISVVKNWTGNNNVEATKKYWYIAVDRWGVNALENTSYYFKNIALTEKGSTQNTFGNWWWSLAKYLHRSYWAHDPHYTTTQYPSQYVPTFDGEAESWTDETTYPAEDAYLGATGTEQCTHNTSASTDPEWNLSYRSYNEIGGKYKHTYSLENTYKDEQGLRGFNPLRHGTHVLIAARMFTSDAATAPATAPSTFETLIDADGYFWDEISYENWVYKLLRENIADGLSHKVKNLFTGEEYTVPTSADENDELYFYVNTSENDTPVYKKIVSDYEYSVATTDKDNLISVANAFYLGKAYLENGDGKRMLKERYPIYVKVAVAPTTEDGETTYEYTAVSRKEFASIVCSEKVAPAGAKYYNEGMMYYAVPVRHYGTATYKGEAGNVELKPWKAGEQGEYELGDFGVVRNHWYDLTVSKFTKPGTPVEDPDDPIVPNDPESYDYIAVELVILPWHVIDQDVEL